MERKWTDRQYHVQDNADVEARDVKIYCNTNQFPELSLSCPRYKTQTPCVMSFGMWTTEG